MFDRTPRPQIDNFSSQPVDQHQVMIAAQRRQQIGELVIREAATVVGKRRCTAVFLAIDASAMHQSVDRFYVTKNNVWLTETVTLEYIRPLLSGPSNETE